MFFDLSRGATQNISLSTPAAQIKVALIIAISCCFYIGRLRAEVNLSRSTQEAIALENIRALEATHMVYAVYENFIVPRICQDSQKTKLGNNKKACKLLPFIEKTKKLENFEQIKEAPLGVLYKANEPLTKAYNPKSNGQNIELVAVAPKGYQVTYVGCYRREEIKNVLTECSLFFMIAESSVATLPPILAIKGSSNEEDWKNNLLAGAPILEGITQLFTGILGKMHTAVIGNKESSEAQDIKGVSNLLSGFFDKLTARSGKIYFTGHSLGGALAQELAREAFIATRRENNPKLGPRMRVITWNALSYTSMIGRLKKGLDKISQVAQKAKEDPVSAAGWTHADAIKLENYKKIFDGTYLSAVNFHSADDILTLLINQSIIGRVLRMGQHVEHIHAGDDITLPTNRYLDIDSVLSKIEGHSTKTLMNDLLFSAGATLNKNGSLRVEAMGMQYSQLKGMEQRERDQAAYKNTPQYFHERGLNSEGFNRDGSMNFDLVTTLTDASYDEKRASHYARMKNSLLFNSAFTGRLDIQKNYTGWISKEFCK